MHVSRTMRVIVVMLHVDIFGAGDWWFEEYFGLPRSGRDAGSLAVVGSWECWSFVVLVLGRGSEQVVTRLSVLGEVLSRRQYMCASQGHVIVT